MAKSKIKQQKPLLMACQMTKTFGDFTANQDIDFTIYAGQLHALLGENGAGKSTFVKMIYGLLQPDTGHLEWQGKPVQIANPRQAREMGIGMVFQHFSLFEALSVAENIALALPADYPRKRLTSDITEKSAEYGIPLNPHSIIADLSVGQRQRVEIMRCLLQDPSLLIMDEPTSVLTPQETTQLFSVLRQLAKQGCAVLFISHKLDEIKQLTSHATIFRGGKQVADFPTKTKSSKQIAELMVGNKITYIQRKNAPKNRKSLFEVRGLSKPAEGHFDTVLDDISITACKGEILGIAGIAGNGQAELMAALTGEWLSSGDEMIFMSGKDITKDGPTLRRRAGICFIPEERNGHAAVPSMSLADNVLLTGYDEAEIIANGIINRRKLLSLSRNISKKFDVRQPSENPLASALSGGNLQKFVVGRELIKAPSVLIVSQPTWGVDIGAAQFIRSSISQLAEKGSAIIMISQDLEEIFSISHKISVLNNGHLSAAVAAEKMTAQKIGLLMGGVDGKQSMKAPIKTKAKIGTKTKTRAKAGNLS